MLQIIYIHIISDPKPSQYKVILYRVIRNDLSKTGCYFKSGIHVRLLFCGKTQLQTYLVHMSIQRDDEFRHRHTMPTTGVDTVLSDHPS